VHESRRKAAGYSLIELMVVVAMVGIVTLVTVPAFVSIMPQYRVRGAASEGLSNFRSVRQMAVTSRRPWKITFVQGSVLPGQPREDWFFFSRLTNPAVPLTTAGNWETMGRDLKPLNGRPLGSAAVRISGVELETETGKPLHDVDCDERIDLIYLRDGTVSNLPDCGGDPLEEEELLDFNLDEADEELPSFKYHIDNDFVRFNTYTMQVTKAGTITVVPEKE
jgi:prepilin-type N-terminal cleavage/methylation domain-containing protein